MTHKLTPVVESLEAAIPFIGYQAYVPELVAQYDKALTLLRTYIASESDVPEMKTSEEWIAELERMPQEENGQVIGFDEWIERIQADALKTKPTNAKITKGNGRS